MTSFWLKLRAPYRSLTHNNTCKNLPLGGGCHYGWSYWQNNLLTRNVSMLNYSRISWNGGYHSLFVVSVVRLIRSILQPNLDREDSNVSFETKAFHFFVLFTYRQVTTSNWTNLTDFGLGQNVEVLTTSKSLLWYQRTAVLLIYYHGIDPKQLKTEQTSLLFQKVTVEFYSSWLLSKYDFWSCVRHSVTLISYLWSFPLTVLKSTSYHKFDSRKTKVSLRSTYLSCPDAFSVIRCIRNKREFLFSEYFRFPFSQTPVIEENIVETIKIYET